MRSLHMVVCHLIQLPLCDVLPQYRDVSTRLWTTPLNQAVYAPSYPRSITILSFQNTRVKYVFECKPIFERLRVGQMLLLKTRNPDLNKLSLPRVVF